MSELSNANYLQAITGGSLGYGLDRTNERFGDFFQFLKKIEGQLKSQGVSIAWPEVDEIPNRLIINTRLGEIEISTLKVLDDGYIGAALLFTDREAVNEINPVRKLYAVALRTDGQWMGSDGESLAGNYGELTPTSAFRAICAAMAAKLKANTETFQSF